MQIMVFITLGLITMSSQSADSDAVDVPLYNHRGEIRSTLSFNREKLSKAIVDRLDDISKVYDMSVTVRQHNDGSSENIVSMRIFRFTAETTEGVTYTNVQCRAGVGVTFVGRTPYVFELSDCGNNQIVFGKINIRIPVSEISYEASKKEEIREH